MDYMLSDLVMDKVQFENAGPQSRHVGVIRVTGLRFFAKKICEVLKKNNSTAMPRRSYATKAGDTHAQRFPGRR